MYTPLELIFRRSKHYLHSLVNENENEREIPISSFKVLNQPLLVRNVSIASRILNINRIKIPSKYSTALKLIQDNFPAINVEEYDDSSGDGNGNDDKNNSNNNNNNSGNSKNKNNKSIDTSTSARSYTISIKENMDYLEIPLNSALWYLQSQKENILINPIVYPWDFHYVFQKILQDELTQASISPNASISKSTIIDGPCIIEDGVTIDDFCKIKGPTYISKGSFIGMSSLIRNCMMGNETRIGFNCEIGRSYFLGHDKIPHQNVIVDSIIGENVWFGGYSVALNALSTKQKIMYEIDKGKSIDTGIDHFGAVIGNNCTIGTSVVVMPGRHIQPGTTIKSESIVTKSIGH
jgi:UDP-N-acetylglucosamine diphosphorylase / glucose-1-phosphate thymidylyltransferase / UDP-N-acetylgalactosamine diphosphorylase / glucosamine-1-phosphate N-acetyltransferase / galactosamine-1-phosphate N-acetyltransferase